MRQRMLKLIALAILALGNIQVGSAEVATERWMEQYAAYIGDKPLNELVIPGTHDSITYTINSRSKFAKEQDVPHQLNWLRYAGVGFIVTKIAADWSKAQGRTVTQQLEDGIRYFDMRVVYRESEKKFYTCHGLYGEELTKVLNDINNFLNAHPKEVVILDFNHLYNMISKTTGSKHQQLIATIQGIFYEKMAPGDQYAPLTPLNKFWEQGYQVVTLYYNDKGEMKENAWHKNNFLMWGAERIWSPWANKQTLNDLKSELDKYVSYNSLESANRFFVVQGILTPSGQTIAASFKPTFKGVRSLRAFAAQTKGPMAQWLREWKGQNKRLNIIMMDFLDDPQLIKEMISLNISPRAQKTPSVRLPQAVR